MDAHASPPARFGHDLRSPETSKPTVKEMHRSVTPLPWVVTCNLIANANRVSGALHCSRCWRDFTTHVALPQTHRLIIVDLSRSGHVTSSSWRLSHWRYVWCYYVHWCNCRRCHNISQWLKWPGQAGGAGADLVGNLAYFEHNRTEHYLTWIKSYFHERQGAHATAGGLQTEAGGGLPPYFNHCYKLLMKNTIFLHAKWKQHNVFCVL